MPATARKSRLALLLIIVTTLFGSTFAGAPAANAKPRQPKLVGTYEIPSINAKVDRAFKIMMAQRGDPYSYGAAGPNAFDCSGLIYWATRQAGIQGVPRTSGAQAGYMRHISRGALRPGDFVFFTSGSRVYHVGIFVSPGRILHAPYSGTSVRIDPIWNNNWFAATLRR